MADDDEPGAKPKKPKKPPLELPDDIGTFGALEWLTVEWKLPRIGYRVVRVERTGGEEDDPITIVLEGLGDQPRVTARFSSERRVRNGVSLRDGISSASSGTIRIPYFTGKDASEVFAALCLAANEITAADEIDEAGSWIEATRTNTEPITASVIGHDEQIATVRRLRLRRNFDAAAARELLAHRLGEETARSPHLPVRVIDPVDGHQYLRVDETYMYCRHLLGATNISRNTFGSRLREVGVTRLVIGGRDGREVIRAGLYLLPDIDLDWATNSPSAEAADV